ncbi:hypothetical protein [Campylobacter fetus]|uniref:Uncharacterized protein n=1 Tax=Campylobacter fetus subsp. testudinum TaxID=1507806 RepID=A0AAX0HD52_CAMFE|nr:hypothetical protein [Campylobacter fetus]OCR91513.1 hypothetical protein CFT12S02225_00160 [Campylobacter fetus subsp. testudinum]OCR93268.1 hypothetical protein CFT12S02263_01370 [Campylobacter fetus subsp. testudinum]
MSSLTYFFNGVIKAYDLLNITNSYKNEETGISKAWENVGKSFERSIDKLNKELKVEKSKLPNK